MAGRGFSALGVALVFLLGGCTAAVGPDPTDSPASETSGVVDGGGSSPSTTVQVSVGPQELPQASMSTEMDPPPPLVKYGVYLDGPGEDPAYQAAVTQRSEDIGNAIAACMAAQGFTYVPSPPQPSASAGLTSLDLNLRYLPVPYLSADRGTVVREGYGVMATPEELAAARGVTVGSPNDAYTSTLSPAEFEAYQTALFGDYNDPVGTSSSSCSGKASAQYPEVPIPDRQKNFDAEFGGLTTAVWNLLVGDPSSGGESIESDSRRLELDAEWESCMAGKGYRLEKLDYEHGPDLAFGLARRTRPDGTVGPFHYTSVNLADVPVEEKSLLGTEPEREVAVADFDCRVETDYMARLTDIRVSLDDQFIAEHQTELDRLVAAAESW